jgi:hypothetical protein
MSVGRGWGQIPRDKRPAAGRLVSPEYAYRTRLPLSC